MATKDDLDVLAGVLREELIARTGDGDQALTDAQARIRELVDQRAGVLDATTREELARRVAQRSFGLGPLEPLLADLDVDEVMVCGTRPVWVERAGRLEPTGVAFADDGELLHAIERILAPLGRRVDEAEPLCDGRLPDGSRVNVVIPPLALDGAALTIRRFRRRGLRPDDLVERGSWTPALPPLLEAAGRVRRDLLGCRGTRT